jgi:hypothetical protein
MTTALRLESRAFAAHTACIGISLGSIFASSQLIQASVGLFLGASEHFGILAAKMLDTEDHELILVPGILIGLLDAHERLAQSLGELED